MDSLTHVVSGALTPMMFKGTPRTRRFVIFGMLCGSLPDIDMLAGKSPEAILSIHRGITHALIIQPALALVMALIFYKTLKKDDTTGAVSFFRIWLIALSALLIHVFLDCMTTFGTQIFLPFSQYRVSLPAMFIVDPLLTVPLLVLLVLVVTRNKRPDAAERALRVSRGALVWLVAYPCLCLGVNYLFAHQLAQQYAMPGNQYHIETIELCPEPLAPFNWKVIGKSKDTYYMSRLLLPAMDRELHFSAHDRPDQALWTLLREKEPVFALYANFVSFPVQNVYMQPNGERRVVFRDLRYDSTMPQLMAKLGRSDGLFIMHTQLDADGYPRGWRFLYRGKDAANMPEQPFAAAGHAAQTAQAASHI